MAPFKVIIVGGGPVGLMQALALSRAKIDFVLVEKRDEIVTHEGAALFVWPQTSRLFHQLGFLDKAEKISSVIDHVADADPNGNIIRNSKTLGNVADSQGYPIRMFDRTELIELLYSQLPDRERRVKTGRRVRRIGTAEMGVIVYFDDNTYEVGSIIIGADGVWSTVRQQLAELAPPGTMEAMPFKVKYTGIYGSSNVIAEQPNGYFINRHDFKDGIGFQLYTTPKKNYFVAFRRADKVKRTDWETTDGEALIEDFLDARVCGDVTIRDVWEGREWSGATELHQGLLKNWHWHRIALVGDAVLKVTPNQGSGANNGFESAVSLANALQNMLRSNPDPNTAAIEQAFAAYQEDRWSRGETWVRGANDNMGMLLWSSRFKKAMATHVVPVADKMGIIEGRVNRLVSKSSQFNPVLTDESQVTIASWDSYTNEW